MLPPNYQPYWLQRHISTLIALAFISVAISAEVVYFYSRGHHGFDFNFIDVAQSYVLQFLKSFLPALLFIPLNWLYANCYDSIRTIQPYLALSKGNAKAEDSVLVNYGSKSSFSTLLEAMSRRHHIVFMTALFSTWSALYSALGGTLFNVAPVSFNLDVGVRQNPIGTWNESAFWFDTSPTFYGVGYAGISGLYGTTYPPFMFVDPDEDNTAWMVAPFKIEHANETLHTSRSAINGTQRLRVPDVPAVRVHTSCVGVPVANRNATLSPTCRFPVGDGKAYDVWQPYMWIIDRSCIKLINSSAPDPGPNLSSQLSPVHFQFYKNETAASAAFCYATYELYQITAVLDVTLRRLVPQVADLNLITGYFGGSDFTWARNGFYIQNSNDYNNALAYSYARKIVYELGGALNSINNNIPYMDSVLSNSTAVAKLAQDTYLLCQTLIAASFVNSATVRWVGTYSYEAHRIVAFGPSAHAIAALTGLTGLALLYIFHEHANEREKVAYLPKPPTNIAEFAPLVSEQSETEPQQSATLTRESSQDPLITRNVSGQGWIPNGEMGSEEMMKIKLNDWRFSFENGKIVGRRREGASDPLEAENMYELVPTSADATPLTERDRIDFV